MISVFISNLSEDVWPFIQGISDSQKRDFEIRENIYLADRDLFTACNETKFILVSPNQVSDSFLSYYHDLLGNHLLAVLNPAGCSGEICRDILADKELSTKLLKLGKREKGIKLLSYSASPQFYELYNYLSGNGFPVLVDESPEVDSAWTVNFFGSKSGIRQTSSLLFVNGEVKCSRGCVVNDPKVVPVIARFLYQKSAGVVVKTNKGHSGMGLLMYSKASNALKLKVIEKELGKDSYWSKNPIVVEEYVEADLSVAGGAPNVEFLVDKEGEVKFLYDGGMRVTPEGVFKGMEIGPGVVPEKARRQMLAVGQQVGELYSQLGYRGYFDIDFIVDRSGKLYITESNVRKTGGTHAYSLGRRLFGEDFTKKVYTLFNNGLDFPQGKNLSFMQIKRALEPFLFQKEEGEGLVIIFENLIKLGEFGYVVFAQDRKRAHKLEEEAIKTLLKL